MSFRSTFESVDAPTPKESGSRLFFTMLGSRAVWHRGWKAVSVHPTIAGWSDFGRDRWELYNSDEDPTEMHDLAAQEGHVILGASFVRDGDTMPATGMLSLFVDDEKVGEGRITTQPGNFSLVGEGLNVGKDPASPVTDDYPGESPHAFTGGTIREAVVDVSGEEYVNLELEALAMLKRE